jgi:hypothetical protein
VDTVLYNTDTVLVPESEYPAGIGAWNLNKSELKIFHNIPIQPMTKPLSLFIFPRRTL